MDKYNYNWRFIIEGELPSRNRKPKYIAWLHALYKAMRMMHEEFLVWGKQKKDEVMWNSQTIVLRHLLIQRFGPGIWIENKVRKAPLQIGYPFQDNRNVIGYKFGSGANRIGYPFGQFDTQNIGFVVWVPSTLVFNEDNMKALIDYYLMFGVKYSIQSYII